MDYEDYFQKHEEALKLIRKKYPLLFERYTRNGRKMMAEISIDFGWLPHFDSLCQEIYDFFNVWDTNNVYGFKWVQVKEKFGGLRLHYDSKKISEKDRIELNKIMIKYEKIVMDFCEKCGKPGKLRTDTGWITVLCDEHHQISLERNKELYGK